MNAQIASAFVLLTVGASVAAAQQPTVNDRVAKAMPTTYQPAQCNIKPNHFKVGSAAGYVKAAIETDVPESKVRILGQAEKVDLEAIQQNGQEKNPAAWYYLGRIYLMQGKVAPADSALTKAEQLAPDCAKDINVYRRNAWVALINAGSKFEEDKNTDSAFALYRQANSIYRGSPIGFYRAASIFNDRGQADSAAYYFGLAAATVAPNATDTTEVKYRNNSAFSQGVLLLNAKKYDQAAPVFEQYLKWVPNDAQAKRGLAAAYRGLGQNDKATALEKEVAASGDAATGAGGAGGGAGTDDVMSAGISLFKEKKYADAAAAFEKVVAAEPYNRDALSSLANTYLALGDGPKLLATSQRLVAIEPMSESALKLLGEGYKQSKKVDDAVKTAEQVLALPANVRAANFATQGTGASLTLTATGRAAQTPSGKPITPAAVPITVEFIDAGGQPVATQEATIPAVADGASQDVKVDAQGAGIAAWRYKRK
ncbi:MAG TPA: tetratricopeptide repeat protein [Gemmatimonadales bacterium]|nr:tetratricopeptide repeat protein [Gemmatimonadales bacterium]